MNAVVTSQVLLNKAKEFAVELGEHFVPDASTLHAVSTELTKRVAQKHFQKFLPADIEEDRKVHQLKEVICLDGNEEANRGGLEVAEDIKQGKFSQQPTPSKRMKIPVKGIYIIGEGIKIPNLEDDSSPVSNTLIAILWVCISKI